MKCIFCLKIDTSDCLCAAGTLHAKCDKVDDKHVHEFTEKIKNQDIKLGETQILARVSTGDVTTNKIFYHKTCLTNFNNQYRSALFKEHKLLYLDINLNEEFRKAFAFNKIVSFIYEQRNIQADFLFEVISLENMYRELPQYDNIIYTSHVSRFTERLKSAIPELEKRFINKKTLICFSTEVNNIMQEEIEPTSFIKSLMKIISPIRKDMSEVKNSFQGKFPDDCQQNSIPIRLLSLCSMLIDGFDPQEKGFSKSCLTVSQLVMHEYRKKSIPIQVQHKGI